jgi:hypothetical protein
MGDITGDLELRSTKDMDEAVEANASLFVESLSHDSDREYVLAMLAKYGTDAEGKDKKTAFEILTELAGFKNDFIVESSRDRTDAEGIQTRAYYFDDDSSYGYTEEYLRFIASLGFGVDADFEGEPREFWMFKSVLGAGFIEKDMIAFVPSRRLAELEAIEKGMQEIRAAVYLDYPEKDEADRIEDANATLDQLVNRVVQDYQGDT